MQFFDRVITKNGQTWGILYSFKFGCGRACLLDENKESTGTEYKFVALPGGAGYIIEDGEGGFKTFDDIIEYLTSDEDDDLFSDHWGSGRVE